MPELPEVESFRRRFAAVALQREIREAEVLDNTVLRGVPPQALQDFLQGNTLTDTRRRGKYFFALSHRGPALHIHLGMTGDFRLFEPDTEAPRFARVILRFLSGPSLAYTDPRKFGHFYPVEDPETFLDRRGVGPDALQIREADFLARLAGRRGILKAALLDQSLIAGLGNLWIDEICLDTLIHPASRLEHLPEERLRTFYRVMQRRLEQALAENNDARTYPTDSLWSWREAGYRFPDGRGPVSRLTLAGRTTYTIPDQVRFG